ncbi:MAG TPA: FmdB family zinc ribbon protein [Acidobacteriota bacterium]|nr:FmdB family zinc ribbon protein [Acidobacteriota bacterium]
MTQFRCMMCGHEFEDSWSKDDDHEVSCPNCKSNSCRRLKAKKAAAPKK